MSKTPAAQVSIPRRRRGLSLGVTLLLGMLAVVVLSVGSTYVFSNLAVQGEFRRLPPEVRQYLRAQQEALRRGEVIVAAPTPQIRTGTPADAYLPPGRSSPDVNGVVRGPDGADTVIEAGARIRGEGSGSGPPRGFTPRTQDFLENIQRNLLRVGMLAAGASALLAFFLSRRLVRPILAVSAAAAGMARGDLSVRAPVLSGERELAELAGNFNEMAANLQSLEKERRQAVADIAHELRTPLAIMQARLDALEDGVYPLNPEQVTLLSQQTQQLTRLVDDLRVLTLAAAGRLSLYPEPLDLAELSAGVVRDLGDRAGARGVSLSLDAPAPTPLRADAGRVRQIAVNLLENALQHAAAQVRVSVEASGGAAWLHVDDDGPGIPEASREAVFARFMRLDDSRTRGTGGSGLGLAIVQELAQAHGGAASADRGPLGGARLSVRLPLTAVPEGRPAQ